MTAFGEALVLALEQALRDTERGATAPNPPQSYPSGPEAYPLRNEPYYGASVKWKKE